MTTSSETVDGPQPTAIAIELANSRVFAALYCCAPVLGNMTTCSATEMVTVIRSPEAYAVCKAFFPPYNYNCVCCRVCP